MTLLSIIQDCATKVGINRPDSVIDNTATEVMELLAFANEECAELMRRNDWQVLRKEQTQITLAAEEQTDLPSDFDRFINQTFWNRTRRHPLNGPLSPQKWQYTKSWLSSPVTDSFTVRGNKILINPVPDAGETLAYEYISKNFCRSSLGVEQSVWTADTDTGILDERLIGLGIITRFKLSKGLDASGDLSKYETQVLLAIGYESPKAVVEMSSMGPKVGPAVVIQDGDWPV